MSSNKSQKITYLLFLTSRSFFKPKGGPEDAEPKKPLESKEKPVPVKPEAVVAPKPKPSVNTPERTKRHHNELDDIFDSNSEDEAPATEKNLKRRVLDDASEEHKEFKPPPKSPRASPSRQPRNPFAKQIQSGRQKKEQEKTKENAAPTLELKEAVIELLLEMEGGPLTALLTGLETKLGEPPAAGTVRAVLRSLASDPRFRVHKDFVFLATSKDKSEDDAAKDDDQDEVPEEEEKKQEEKPQFSLKRKPMEEEATPSKKSAAFNLKGHFDPVQDAIWKAGEPVPYLALARTFEAIEKITSRLDIMAHLTRFFRSVIQLTPGDLLPCIYLSINKMGPSFEGLELGIGESLILKAVAEATGRTLAVIKASYDRLGDLGQVAEESRGAQKTMFKPAPLTVRGVFKTFLEMARESGHASMNKKKSKIQGLVVASRECEARFIVKSCTGRLRIGLAEKSMLVALAHAFVLSPPGRPAPRKPTPEQLEAAAEKVKMVYSELPNYDAIVPVLLNPEEGLEKLHEKCHLVAGVPVNPMLAQPTKGIREVLSRFEDMQFTTEYKYDGERAQVHQLEDGSVHIYSRNLEVGLPPSVFPEGILPEGKS